MSLLPMADPPVACALATAAMMLAASARRRPVVRRAAPPAPQWVAWLALAVLATATSGMAVAYPQEFAAAAGSAMLDPASLVVALGPF